MTSLHQYCFNKCKSLDIDDISSTDVDPNSSFFIHYNVRGLASRLDDLKELLCNLKDKGIIPAAILMCETFLNSNNVRMCKIEGYTLVHNNRKSKGGGVAIYIFNPLNFSLRDDLTYNINNQFETIFIELTPHNQSKKILIGEIYRTPDSNPHSSLERYTELLEKLNRTNKHTIIGTDQNFDLLQTHVTMHSDFLNTFISHGLTPCITQPTRVTQSTATLIDNFYTKGIKVSKSHVITAHSSDHFPIMISTAPIALKLPKSVTFQARNFTPQVYLHIVNELQAQNWQQLHHMNTNTAFTHFMSTLTNIIDTHAPLKTFIVKRKNIRREPWFTKALQISSKKLRKLYKEYISSKDIHAHNKYIEYRNLYNKIRKAAKTLHYSSLFNEYRNNIKKTWNLINSLTGTGRRTDTPVNSLFVDNTHITNPNHIAETFATHFASVSTKTHGHTYNALDHAHIRLSDHTFFLLPTTPHEILKIINAIKPKKSAGHDALNSQLLKHIKFGIITPLDIIINKSFTEGIFPTSLKISKVIPIHKNKDKSFPSNYRPISLLPSISKIFEKILVKRLTHFLNSQHLLTDHQFGFRKNHSTVHAITKFTLNIISNITVNKPTIATFIDFSKAFDRIDHQILLHKLYLYGIRGTPLTLITSYLKHRSFFVSHNNCISQHKIIDGLGIPQGSVLGPLLFLIYINDLPQYLSDSNTVLFADDTTIYQSHENLNILHANMNTSLQKLNHWCNINQIQINQTKTKYMIFNSHSQSPPSTPSITLNGTPIEQVQFFKFLGITIDNKLTWSEHTKNIKLKIAQGMHALSSIKNFSTTKIRTMIYHSLIHSHLTYGCHIWGNALQKHTRPLYITQKKALRKIENAPYNSPSAPLFLKHQILTLAKLYKYQTILLMHDFHNAHLPNALMTLFTQLQPAHSNTRTSHLIRPPQSHLRLTHSSTLYTGPQLYRSAPPFVRTTQNAKGLKKALKKHIIAN